MGSPDGFLYHEGLPRHFGGLSIFSGGGPPYDPGERPLVSQEEVPVVNLDPLDGGPPGPLASQEEVPLGPHSLPGPPGAGTPGPPRSHSGVLPGPSGPPGQVVL